MKTIITFLLAVFLSFGYSSAQTANFTYTLTNSGCSPDSVIFTNTSTGAVSYLWNFDNPWGDTSTTVNPYHIYLWGGAYTVQLIAYDGLGDSSVTSQLILINDPPSAWFNSDPPIWNDICNGDSIIFTNQTWPGADSTHWFFGDGDSSYTYNTGHIYPDTGTYNMMMIAYAQCGIDTAFQTVHITNSAPPSAIFWTSPSTVCPGQEVSFNNNSQGNITAYEWDFNEDWVADNTDEIPPNQTFTTTTDVSLIVYNNCSSDTAIRTITVDPTLVPNVWAGADRDSVCLNEEVNFTGNGNYLVSYNWTFGDGNTSNQQNPVHSYSNYGNYQVIFTGMNLCGNSNSDTLTVVVDSNATPDPSFWINPWDPCPGTNVYFTNNSLDTNYYVFWDFGDGATSTDINPVHAYASLGNYDVKLILENSCGKRDSLIQTLSVVSDGMPWANWNATPWPGGQAICIGTAIQFENFSTDTSNCLWDFGDGNTSTEVNPVHSYASSGVYTVLLTVTNNCGNSNTSWPQSFTVRDDVPPTANFDIWTSPCPQEEIQLWNNSSDPNNSLWNFGDGDTSTETNPFHAWLSSGTYNVNLIVSNACGSDTDNHTINIKQGSVANFISDAPTCLGNLTSFTDMSTNSPDSWAWDLGDGNTASVQNPTNTYGISGTYTVDLTVSKNGCTSHILQTVDVIELSSLMSHTDATCNGSNDGSATITVTGGSSYTYLWSDGQTTATAIGLYGGTYYCTATDISGCNIVDTAIVSEPAALTITMSHTDVTCNGVCDGTATASVSGGTAPYTYLWSNSQTTQTATGLCAGTYVITVTDANYCTAVSSVTINEPSILTITMSHTDVTCNGICDGTATASVSGGIAPYTYNWSNSQTTQTATGLCAGFYGLTITDANGCTAVSSVTINEPAVLTIAMSHTDVTCNGVCDGTATASVSGGTAPYTYSWSNGDTANPAINLCAGNYWLTVTDVNGCNTIGSVTISEPAILSVSISSQVDASCNGLCDGSATVTASGGTAPYSYLWDNLQTTQIATGLCAGTYNITVTDSSGCTGSTSVTITEPTAITVTETISNSTCGNSDGQIDIIVAGGTPSYIYTWSNGNTTTSNTGLAAASYDLTVTDAAGCIYTNTYAVNDMGAPTFTIDSVINASCNSLCDGKIYTSTSGGSTPYSFAWNIGATTQNITGLCAGNYTGTVTDTNGCIASVSGTVIEPTLLSVVMSSTNDNGTGNGTATATVSGGTSPYTYLWNDGASQTTPTAINLYVGTYSVSILDSKGCGISDSVVVDLNVEIGNSGQDVYLKIFPNPNAGDFIVEYSGTVNENIKLEVFDIGGQILYKTILSKQNKKRNEIHLKNVSPGIYFLKISNKTLNKTKKIIVN